MNVFLLQTLLLLDKHKHVVIHVGNIGNKTRIVEV